MSIQEFYKTIGSDYYEVEKRLGSGKMVTYFVSKFAKDKTFDLLASSYRENNAEGAFRASHTLKGICSNLGFGRLYEASAALTEALRGRSMEGSDTLYGDVVQEYNLLIGALRELTVD